MIEITYNGKDITKYVLIYVGIIYFPKFMTGLILLLADIIKLSNWIIGVFS